MDHTNVPWQWLLLVLLFVSQNAGGQTSNSTAWKTLKGGTPLIIAHGGASGLYPDQTFIAYADALNKSLPSIALFCDIQMTMDNSSVCRSGLDLVDSTFISQVFSGRNNTYTVNGEKFQGYFSVDFTLSELVNNVTARQSDYSRTNSFDIQYIYTPDDVAFLISSYNNQTGNDAVLWLNMEYATFYEQHNAISYVQSLIRSWKPAYISSTEVGFLKSIQKTAQRYKTKLIFSVPEAQTIEPSTSRSYDSILKNLTFVKSISSGVLVPKGRILPIDSSSYHLENYTTLAYDAHQAGLEVYASLFKNDEYPSSFNYSFNPIQEYQKFVTAPTFAVDGVLSDFPFTASVAIACYSEPAKTSSAPTKLKQLIISHNGGDCGNYPGSTQLAYTSAINAGVDYIDCAVQMTKDGIPFCRQSVDLLVSTNVAASFLDRLTTLSTIQSTAGIFSFNLTWEEVNSLRANIYSPYAQSYNNMTRDTSNDGKEKILKLSDFLGIASNHSGVGIYIVLRNAYYINATIKLDATTAIIDELKGWKNNSNVYIQSDDYVVLEKFQGLGYKRIYDIQSSQATLTSTTLQRIQKFADGVAVSRNLVAPVVNSFLARNTDVVKTFHDYNLTVFINFIRNEFVSIAFDLYEDPIIQIDNFVRFNEVDGLITDFPATAVSYKEHTCDSPHNKLGYSMPLITAGLVESAPSPSPAPDISISEPNVNVTTAPSPTISGAPKLSPSHGARISPSISLVSLFIAYQLFMQIGRF